MFRLRFGSGGSVVVAASPVRVPMASAHATLSTMSSLVRPFRISVWGNVYKCAGVAKFMSSDAPAWSVKFSLVVLGDRPDTNPVIHLAPIRGSSNVLRRVSSKICVCSMFISFHDQFLRVGNPKSGDVVYTKYVPTVAAEANMPWTYPDSVSPNDPGVPGVP